MNSIDEFLADINKVANNFPAEAEEHLKNIGSSFVKIIRKKSPDSGKKNKRKLKRSWKTAIVGARGQDLVMNIWSTSPHFHLVDRGHVQKDAHGNVKGFVQGKHFLAETVQEVSQNIVPAELDKFFNEIKNKIET